MIIDSPIISGSLAASGSLNQVGDITITGSLTVTGNIIGSVTGSVDSASFATVAGNAQLLDNKDSTEFAVTSSNTFTGKQRITDTTNPTTFTSTASLYTDGGLRVTKDAYISGSAFIAGNFTVFGTSSIEYVTSSTFIGLEYIDLNTDLPALRYAGIRVYDSGSPSESTSSLLWDSQNNKWIYSNPSTVGYSGGMLISGPRNTGSLGDEQGTTNNALMKGQGGDHITSSQVVDDGTTVSIPGNLTVTGSIIGSLTGTAATASYWSGSILNATSASFAETASFALNVPLTSSFALTASYWSGSIDTASFALTASYATNAGAGAGFPFSGSAVITGSLQVTNLTGSGTAYLVADSTGSILRQNASAALKTTQAFTSSAGQTSFNVTNGYTTGYVDVFINGTKLSAGEFTDTSGTNIVLTTGSFDGDIVEVVKYLPADGVSTNVLRIQTNFIATAGQTVFSASYAPGLLDIFYNGSRLSYTEYTANNGTYFTLATASNAGDVLDVFNYSYQIGGFSGIGGNGAVNQIPYFYTTHSITGSPNFTISGSTMTITGSLLVSGSGTFTNIGPAVMSGSLSVSGAITTNSTITAQTLVVQTITSSVDFVTGSTQFGSLLTNTHVFSGSVSMNPGGLFVSGSGNVGIGTITPTGTYGKLSVAGGISILDDNNAKLEIGRYSSGAPNSYIKIGTNSNSLRITNAADSADLFTISGSGNVGINTTSPANLLHLAGASATPSLRLGSISTGFHWDIGRENATTGDFVFNNANGGSTSERLRITTGGNVGIGTASITTYSLAGKHMEMFGGNDYSFFHNNTTTVKSFYAINEAALTAALYTFSNHPLGFGTNNTERMRITNGGNVGIGTSSPTDYSGYTTLHVNGKSGSGSGVLRVTAFDGTAGFNIYADNAAKLNTTSAIPIIFQTQDTERMRITSGGDIGIGTNSIYYASGGRRTVEINGTDNSFLAFKTSDVAKSYLFQTGVNFIITNLAAAGGYLALENNGAERLRINSGGGVRIGSTTAFNDDIKFNVYGTGVWNGANIGLQNGGTGGKDWIIFSTMNDFGQGGGNLLFYNNSGPSNNALIIYANGNYDFGGSDVSDIRLKQDIENLNHGLNDIMLLSPKSYYLKSEDNLQEENQTILRKRYGFIAQEVQSILPDTITGEETETDYLGLDYNGVLAVAVKAIQEQQTLITSLQTRIEQLENK